MRTLPNRLSRRLQALEDRWCPASTILVSGGVMRIVGDGLANTVIVSHDGAGNVAATADAAAANAGGITKIVFDLRDGADSVTVRVNGDLIVPLDLRLNLGDGNDTADLKFAAIASDLKIAADLGAGDDRITDLNLDQEIRTGATVGLDVHGGGGADSAVLSVNEVRAGAVLDVGFDGGAGNDAFEARLGDPIETGATVKIAADGGAGDDQFIVDGTTYFPGANLAAGALLDVVWRGGGGNDTAVLRIAAVGGQATVSADLGAGDDRIDVNLFRHIQTGGTVDVDVRGRDGADAFGLTVNDVEAGATLDASFDGAAGDDAMNVRLGQPIGAGASVRIQGSGGNGDDALTVDGTPSSITGASIGTGAELVVDLDGGQGNDSLRAAFDGEVDGTLQIQLQGGKGSDNLSSDVTISSQSTGAIQALLDGGAGDDILALMLNDLTAGAAAVTGRIDGGKGFDICVATPNVDVENCEG